MNKSLLSSTPNAAPAYLKYLKINSIYLNMHIYHHISRFNRPKSLLSRDKIPYSGILDFHYPNRATRDIMRAPKPPPSALEWMCDAKIKTTFHRLSGLDCRPRKP